MDPVSTITLTVTKHLGGEFSMASTVDDLDTYILLQVPSPSDLFLKDEHWKPAQKGLRSVSDRATSGP